VIVIFSKFIATIVGSMLLAVGINAFLVPHHLIDGGIIGIALILHYYFHVQTGMTMLFLSLPICLLAAYYEKAYFLNSLEGLLVSSLFIDLFSPIRSQFHATTLESALLGGIIIGIGVALMLKYETSTGGTDLLARVISKTTSINIAIIIILLDGLIVMAGFALFDLKSFLCSCLAIVIVAFITSSIVKNEG
jgi:uncharacterized membrane-anchored protein YitT (DUF2179 family)